MRLGSLISIRHCMAVQSYEWKLIRPLGKIQGVIKSMDDYQCDELAVIRITRGQPQTDSYIRDLSALEICKSNSPLSFGGGIRNANDINKISKLPIERVVFSSQLFMSDTSVIQLATDQLGRQAIQGLLPFKYENSQLYFYNCRLRQFEQLSIAQLDLIDNLCNEIILYDIKNEGYVDKFDFRCLRLINFNLQKIVISGGIGPNVIKKANAMGLASVLIENRTLHTEYSIKDLKKYARM